MWIFGYGSLVWKVDFPYDKKTNGFIRGYVRRFYQYSVDHRGVPDCPGRVVTLIPSNEDDKVWGVAYHISPENEERVIAHLDYREKDGYKKETILFFPTDQESNSFPITLYIGTETNKWFAGPADIQTIAAQVVRGVGPSGANTEYVYNLAKTIREIAPNEPDDHLNSLEQEVRRLENNQLNN